jgi:CheY-like chemotaxis protein
MAKILVIEDDPPIRQLIVRILSGAGHDLVEASDGQQGLSLFRAVKPALVISDILMPEMDGLEVIRALQREAPEIPILAVSGKALFTRIAKRLGADATLAKPFRTSELVDVVNMLLGS